MLDMARVICVITFVSILKLHLACCKVDLTDAAAYVRKHNRQREKVLYLL